ncbi:MULTISPECIES: amino acid ABC transporter permease [unclassified Pseudomonas]|uniref:amino acid ABC transporter permease n=1 Tax=unclassified Pseudomonas TaxID=196821 RepID=UPI001CBF8FAA|nr:MULTISPECIES: amino acid ABC transporter permease [unclassified Pseudomonas]
MNYHFQWNPVWKAVPDIMSGLYLTIELTITSFILGAVISFALAWAKQSEVKLLRGMANSWIELARNTPCLFQIYMAYFGLGAFGIEVDSYAAVLGAITFNTAGYMAEIVRGGLASIDPRQSRAAAALGMNKWQIFSRILLPQLIPLIYPATSNQLIWSLLNTSLGMVVGLQELTGATYAAQSLTFRSFEFFIVTAVVYYVLVKLVMLLMGGSAWLFVYRKRRS